VTGLCAEAFLEEKVNRVVDSKRRRFVEKQEEVRLRKIRLSELRR